MNQIDIQRILSELTGLPNYDTHIGLQCVPGTNDAFGATRVKREGDLIVPAEHNEEDFKEFVFDFPYTNNVLEKLQVFRARVMKLHPKTCYTYHKDSTKRLHIPLVTNDKCFFVCEDQVERYPADGNFFILDTTKMHTFVNASKVERLHIVACIK